MSRLELVTETYSTKEKLDITKPNKIFGNAVPSKENTYKPPKQCEGHSDHLVAALKHNFGSKTRRKLIYKLSRRTVVTERFGDRRPLRGRDVKPEERGGKMKERGLNKESRWHIVWRFVILCLTLHAINLR